MNTRGGCGPLLVGALIAASAAAAGADPPGPDRPTPSAATTELDASADPVAARDDARYARLIANGPPHLRRALLQEVTLLLGGGLWYWLDRERQVADWDFPSVKERVTLEAWRFDNNGFPMNFLAHPLNGTAFHLAARASGLDLPSSVAVGLLTSLAWEIGLEFREKISINDVLVTTGAGVAQGEFFHWLGRYLESAPSPRRWHPVARWTLSGPRELWRVVDQRPGLRPGTDADPRGLSADIWHRFTLSAGGVGATVRAEDGAEPNQLRGFELRIAGELAALPGYLRPHHRGRAFRAANLTSARATLSLGEDVAGVDTETDTILAGWHYQQLDPRGGAATTIGVALGYRYRRELFGDFTERLAQLHLPGLAIDQHLIGSRVAVRARLRASYDFAGVHATAYRRWQTAHPDEVDKAILRKHGYYYGWGPSARLELELTAPRLVVGGALRWARYRSQEGYDRTQEDITLDVAGADRATEAEAWLRVAPFGGRAYVEARLGELAHDSELGDLTATTGMGRLSVAIGAQL